MAVWAFADQFFGYHAFNKENLKNFARLVQQASVNVLQLAGETLTEPLRLLTLSRSSLVEQYLLKRSPSPANHVVCLESLPAAEGRNLALFLQQHGIAAEWVSDWQVEMLMPQIDAVILGADWITKRFMINKWGSNRLLAWADVFQKPVYILAEAYKQLPLPDNLVTSAFQQDWSDRSGRRRIQVFEKVRRNFAHILISSPSDL
jgi:translation initiation factor 2B subunit (eIF-2B alpha/beta/delta family)